jgi:hypothetical protein
VRYAVLIKEQFLWLRQHVITVRYKLRLKKQLSIKHLKQQMPDESSSPLDEINTWDGVRIKI